MNILNKLGDKSHREERGRNIEREQLKAWECDSFGEVSLFWILESNQICQLSVKPQTWPTFKEFLKEKNYLVACIPFTQGIYQLFRNPVGFDVGIPGLLVVTKVASSVSRAGWPGGHCETQVDCSLIFNQQTKNQSINNQLVNKYLLWSHFANPTQTKQFIQNQTFQWNIKKSMK